MRLFSKVHFWKWLKPQRLQQQQYRPLLRNNIKVEQQQLQHRLHQVAPLDQKVETLTGPSLSTSPHCLMARPWRMRYVCSETGAGIDTMLSPLRSLLDVAELASRSHSLLVLLFFVFVVLWWFFVFVCFGCVWFLVVFFCLWLLCL